MSYDRIFWELWNLDTQKGIQCRNCPHLCQDSSSKFVFNTISLFAAAPSLSGVGAKKFLPMFTHGGNVRKTTETPVCFTVVYPTMETVGGNPVRLRLRIYLAVTGEGNLVWSWGGFLGNRTLFTSFASSNLTTDTSWVWSRLNPRFMRTRAFFRHFCPQHDLRLDVIFSTFLNFFFQHFFCKHNASPRWKFGIYRLKSCKSHSERPKTAILSLSYSRSKIRRLSSA